ncbi:MAG: hypothetical protein M1812_000692 [Candelaria pacifica]|nr:MAG: hypothetical protein M1812_000692 [Candelaria pacifica]
MSSSLAGKTALITGANQGIGLHIAISLAREGVALILFNRTVGKLDGLTKAVPDANVHEEHVDIGDREAVEAAVERTARKYDSVDILVNNAGIALGAPKNFWEQDLGAIHSILGTNINGLVNVTHAIMKKFLIPQNRGTILDISSTTALEAPPPGFGEVIYHSTKSFMEAFTNALRNETIGTNIRVLALRPGFVRTNFHFQRVGRHEQAFEGVFEGTDELRAEDVAEAAMWQLKAPERISVKALDIVPSSQRALSAVDRGWVNRQEGER